MTERTTSTLQSGLQPRSADRRHRLQNVRYSILLIVSLLALATGAMANEAALQIFEEVNYQGIPSTLEAHKVYSGGAIPKGLNRKTSSLILKKGYQACIAAEEKGQGLSKSDTTAYQALEAVAREFNRDELKALIPVFIEALENEKKSRWLYPRWTSAAHALMKLGPEAKPALTVLMKRIDCRSRDMQWRVIEAIGSIGGPEARKAVPKLKEQLKSPAPGVRRVTTEALRNLGL